MRVEQIAQADLSLSPDKSIVLRDRPTRRQCATHLADTPDVSARLIAVGDLRRFASFDEAIA